MRPESRLAKWRAIVSELDLDLAQPINRVSAQEIKAWSNEEPRLMAKIDRREELPAVFREAGVFLLPVANGEYVVVQGDGYHDLEAPARDPSVFVSQLPFPLTSSTAGASESQYIDVAFNSGLISKFTGVGSLFMTIRGRKRSPEFDFRVGTLALRAASVQVEVDAGFEGEDHIVVLEGKVGTPDNFHIRQLYYPYRFWRTIVPEKDVLPVFFTYRPDQRLTTFWLYEFEDPHDFLSIHLVRAQSFLIQPATATISQLPLIPAEPQPTPDIVPQADDVQKIAELPFRVAEGITTSDGIAGYFGFQQRQANYYRQAAEALDLVVVRDGRYTLTAVGREYVALPVAQRNEFLFRRMLRLPVVDTILKELLVRRTLSVAEVRAIVARSAPLSGATLERRTTTIFSWLRWVQRTVGLVEVRRTGVRLVGGMLF